MADNIQVTIGYVARGLRDSIKGLFKLYNMDQGLEDEKERKEEDEQPMSILAQRRAERSKGRETKKKSKKDQKVMPRIMLCCAWNGGVFLASILLFHYVLIPTLKCITHLLFGSETTHYTVWSYIGPMLSWTFGALWVLPLFVLSKVVNSLWFQDIADAAYRKTHGRPQTMPSFSKVFADILFSLLLQSLFLIQGMLASLLPIAGLGYLVSQLHMCLLYSLYAFEYKWFNMGWEVHRRLSYIESNWPYFLGFGLPLALLTSWPSSAIISGCVFSILFPLFIISANEADNIDRTFDYPLKLFSPVVSILNKAVQTSVKKTQFTSPAKTSQPSTPSKRVTLQDKR